VHDGTRTTGMVCAPVNVIWSTCIWFVPSTAMYVLITTASSEAMFCRLICPSTMKSSDWSARFIMSVSVFRADGVTEP